MERGQVRYRARHERALVQVSAGDTEIDIVGLSRGAPLAVQFRRYGPGRTGGAERSPAANNGRAVGAGVHNCWGMCYFVTGVSDWGTIAQALHTVSLTGVSLVNHD